MTAIALTKHELLQLKLLLRDIQLIQKMNSPFDNEAIEILSFKIIEHLNNDEKPTSSQTEISDEEIEMAALHHEPRITRRAFKSGAKWYREQLKQRQ